MPGCFARAGPGGGRPCSAGRPSYVTTWGNHYFPLKSVRHELLTGRARPSHCFWKTLARYRSIAIGGARLARGAWYYPQPLPWIKIKDHVAFGPGVVITSLAIHERPSPRGPDS